MTRQKISNVRTVAAMGKEEERFSDRLKSLHRGQSLASFAALIGESDTTLGNYERGTRVPKADFLARLKQRTGVDLNWLISGEPSQDSKSGNFEFVPKLSIKASAGNGSIALAEDNDRMLAFRSEWLRRRGINPSAAAVLTATGDSNEPTIRDGDILLVDTSIREIRDNGFYIIVINDLIFVKRLHMSLNGSITLISDNSVYPPEQVQKGEPLALRGRVMWFGRSI